MGRAPAAEFLRSDYCK